jgi:phosphoribosyl 1,2-cyclic phosphodiesterase
MLRFCSLGSGSSGNATLVEGRSGAHRTRLLIDCGFSLRELESRALRAGVALEEIDAAFVTHEHTDHIGCAIALARRCGTTLVMSRGTWRAIGEPEEVGPIVFARDGERLAIGELELAPYTVPHDAGEPLQLTLSDGAARLGVLTDAGAATPHLLRQLMDCAALLLECNHDREMLALSSYPASLKARIGSRLGHLANDAAAEILAACSHARLHHVGAAHLSERNNTPALAVAALAAALGAAARDIVVADPLAGFGWLDLAAA